MKCKLISSGDMKRFEGLAIALMYKRLAAFRDVEEAVYQELDKITGQKYHEGYLRSRVSYAFNEIIRAMTNDSLVKSYNPDKHIKHILQDLK